MDWWQAQIESPRQYKLQCSNTGCSLKYREIQWSTNNSWTGWFNMNDIHLIYNSILITDWQNDHVSGGYQISPIGIIYLASEQGVNPYIKAIYPWQ